MIFLEFLTGFYFFLRGGPCQPCPLARVLVTQVVGRTRVHNRDPGPSPPGRGGPGPDPCMSFISHSYVLRENEEEVWSSPTLLLCLLLQCCCFLSTHPRGHGDHEGHCRTYPFVIHHYKLLDHCRSRPLLVGRLSRHLSFLLIPTGSRT